MNSYYSIVFCLLFLNYCVCQDYKPVENLELDKYTGRWFQTIKDVFDMSFQGLGTCAVADYSMENNSNITVLNSQFDKDGSVDQIKGQAYYQEGKSGGDLTIDLDGTPGNSAYWVIELGPIVNDQYQYSIVSDNLQLSLFVLVRNVTEYYNKYDKKVLNSIREYGFTKEYNKPKTMDQADCNYDAFTAKGRKIKFLKADAVEQS
jgi:lipocalin